MHGSDYRLIASSKLREVLRGVCNDPRDLPGRKELRAQLVEALPDADVVVIDALMTKATEFATAAVDPGARFDLRASADALTLHVLKSQAAADALVPVEAEEVTELEWSATPSDAVKAAESGGWANPLETPEFKAAAREADITNAKRLASS